MSDYRRSDTTWTSLVWKTSRDVVFSRSRDQCLIVFNRDSWRKDRGKKDLRTIDRFRVRIFHVRFFPPNLGSKLCNLLIKAESNGEAHNNSASRKIIKFPIIRLYIACLLINRPSLAIDVVWSITHYNAHTLRWCNLSLITRVINGTSNAIFAPEYFEHFSIYFTFRWILLSSASNVPISMCVCVISRTFDQRVSLKGCKW